MRTCVICGKAVTKRPGPGRWPDTCSVACRKARVRHRTAAYRVTHAVPQDCAICGEAFQTRCRNQGATCTRPDCRAAWRRLCKTRRLAGTATTCRHCGAVFTPKEYFQVFCSYRCRDRHWSTEKRHRRRAAHRKPVAGEGSVSRAAIYRRDGGVCQICGQRVRKDIKHPHPKSASIDHIVALSRGGEHTMRNCQLAHLGCNSRKWASAGAQMRLFG